MIFAALLFLLAPFVPECSGVLVAANVFLWAVGPLVIYWRPLLASRSAFFAVLSSAYSPLSAYSYGVRVANLAVGAAVAVSEYARIIAPLKVQRRMIMAMLMAAASGASPLGSCVLTIGAAAVAAWRLRTASAWLSAAVTVVAVSTLL